MVPASEAELVSNIKLCFMGEEEKLAIATSWLALFWRHAPVSGGKAGNQMPQSPSCPHLNPSAQLTLASCVRRTNDLLLIPYPLLKVF